MAHTHHDDHDVIVERDSGTGVGTIVGIILAVMIVLALVWYFGFGGFNAGGERDQDININVPAEPAPPGGGEEPAP